MKNILIATDFSDNAKQAARYGFCLAEKLKADVILSNAFIIPAEIPEGGSMIWPQYEYDDLLAGSKHDLDALKQELQKENGGTPFVPEVTYETDAGALPDVINAIASRHPVDMLVMGTHGQNVLSGLMVGNHSRRMIDETTVPLFLVPPSAKIAAPKKIAFATDFEDPDHDLEAIYSLIPMLKLLNAELLLIHTYNNHDHGIRITGAIEKVLVDLSNKADYANIYYRIIKSEKPELGLDWLCQFGSIDVLAMVHRKRSFLGKVLGSSHTKRMAGRIDIPLLVLPEKN